MPWTEITRLQYRRDGLRFASMTDAEWALIAHFLPPRRRLGRPRTTDLRRVIEAILYVLATGCQWRALPGDFPPRSTVQGYFYAWRDTGWWQRVVTVLVRRGRRALGRSSIPTTGIMDSQSAPTTRAAVRVATTLANGFMGVSVTSSRIRMAFYSPCACTRPTSRMFTVQFHCWSICAPSSPSSAMSIPIASTEVINLPEGWRIADLGQSRSSHGPQGSKASNCCRGDGSWNVPSLGSAAVAGSPKTSSAQLPVQPPGSSSPISGSSSAVLRRSENTARI